jgi:hypothetical protein
MLWYLDDLEYLGLRVVEQDPDPAAIWWGLLEGSNGHRVLVIQSAPGLTYRENAVMLRDPTEADLESVKKDAWVLWNSGDPRLQRRRA